MYPTSPSGPVKISSPKTLGKESITDRPILRPAWLIQNLFIFLGTLWSVSTIFTADPELKGRLTLALAGRGEQIARGTSLPPALQKYQYNKTTVVLFDNCLGCNSKNLIYINRLHDILSAKGEQVVLITQNSAKEVAPLLLPAKTGQVAYLRCQFISDPNRQCAVGLNVRELPQIAEFDNGQLIWSKPAGVNWFAALQTRLEERGMKKEAALLSSEAKNEIPALQNALETCRAK